MPGRDAYATPKQCILAAAMVCGRDVGKLLAGKPAMQNCSKSGKPVKWQSRANPGWIVGPDGKVGLNGRVNIRDDLLSNLQAFSLPTDVFVDGRGAVPQMSAVPGGQNGGDLGDDGHGYFLRRLAAELETISAPRTRVVTLSVWTPIQMERATTSLSGGVQRRQVAALISRQACNSCSKCRCRLHGPSKRTYGSCMVRRRSSAAESRPVWTFMWAVACLLGFVFPVGG